MAINAAPDSAYAERDPVTLVGCFPHEVQVIAFGTDAAERRTGLPARDRRCLCDRPRFATGVVHRTWTATATSRRGWRGPHSAPWHASAPAGIAA